VTFLSHRAHVPFVPGHPRPGLFSPGLTGRRLENTCDLKRRSVVRMIRLRLLGFNSRLRSRARSTRSNADPALGFASCRVDGHMAVHPSELEDRFGSPASGAPRPSRFSLAAQLQSAHGFAATPSRRVFLTKTKTGSEGFAREGHIPVMRVAPECLVCRRGIRRPFSVLMGLMPGFSRRLRGSPGKLPV
jgi:hypothetical protein